AVLRPPPAIISTALEPSRHAQFRHHHRRADSMTTQQNRQAADPAIDVARAQWAAAADGWDAQAAALRNWLSRPTQTMLEMAAIEPGHCVLDVAAGAGGQTIALAQRIGPQGRIVATDLSGSLVERLRRNTSGAGFPVVEARAVDAQA